MLMQSCFDEERNGVLSSSMTELARSKSVSCRLNHGQSCFETDLTENRIRAVAQLWSMNQEDLEEFRKLQDRLSDIKHWKNCPEEVVRFFLGPLGKKHAESLFRKMIEWRAQNNADRILEDYSPPKLLLDYLPCAVLSTFDKEGDPIYLERGGVTEPVQLMKRFGKPTLVKHAVWFRELMSRGPWHSEYERQVGRPVRMYTVIYDLEGFGSRQMTPVAIDMFKTSVEMVQNYYTGPLKRMIIIRAPALFRIMWGMIKHVIPREEQNKIVFAGPSNHLDVLSCYVDIQQLPSCINPDGNGGPLDCMRFISLKGGALPPPTSEDHLPAKVSITETEDELSADEMSLDEGKIVRVRSGLMGSGRWETTDDGSSICFVESS